MSDGISWVAAFCTVGILIIYEVALTLGQRIRPDLLARTEHARLREEWFRSVSAEKGSELLAVQTLRNSLMSATMTASTAVLSLMGTVTLAAPSLNASLAGMDSGVPSFTPRLMLELVLMTSLFASLVASVMAVRYYNHASFICAMPVGSAVRQGWLDAGAVYVRRAGLLYSWGLRNLIMVAPIVTSILHPLVGLASAGLVVLVMSGVDRIRVPARGV
jgi:hypothetical protein